MSDIASRDGNFVTTLLAVSSDDGVTPVVVYADPVTHRLLVDLSGSGSGDVVGPASSTDNAVARFNGTGGKTIQNSAVIIADTTGAITGTESVTIGVAGSATGTLLMKGTTSGTVTIQTASTAGTWALTLPTTAGTVNQVLQTDGTGVTTWASVGTGTVTSVSVTTANGVSGSVATATTTPAITLTLGAITPSGVQVSGLTASEIVLTDASKNLVSAAVATYPSLTELTYVKGVTSAIQTQLGTKQATITFGTGVQTALGVNIGSAGAPVLFDGALGTPTSGTVTNLTGTASININGTVGATTPAAGTFTTVTTSSNIELGNASDTTLSRLAAGIMAVEGQAMNGTASTATAAGTTALTIASAVVQIFTGTTTQTVTLPTTSVVAGQVYTIINQCTTTAGVVTVQSSGANEILKLSYGAWAQFRAVQATPTTAAHWTFIRSARNSYTNTSLTTDTGTTLNADYYSDYFLTAQTGAILLNAPGGTPRDGQTLMVSIASSTTAARAITYNAIFEASTVALVTTTTATTTPVYLGFKYNAARVKWVNLATA